MKKVRELKLEPAEVISPDYSQKNIAELMIKKKTRHLIVAKKGNVKGLISGTDIIKKAVAKGKILDAQSLMSKNLIFVEPEQTAGQALATMLKANQYSLPVIKKEKLYGILTLSVCLGGLNG